jgi:hypothetical protein
MGTGCSKSVAEGVAVQPPIISPPSSQSQMAPPEQPLDISVQRHDATASPIVLTALSPPPVASISTHLQGASYRAMQPALRTEMVPLVPRVIKSVSRLQQCTIEVPTSDSSHTRQDICAVSPLSLDRLEDWCSSSDLFEMAACIQIVIPCGCQSTQRFTSRYR